MVFIFRKPILPTLLRWKNCFLKTITTPLSISPGSPECGSAWRIPGFTWTSTPRDELLRLFDERCSEKQNSEPDAWEKVDVALGMAVYDPQEDESVNDVVRRADKIMYENKWNHKKNRQDWRIIAEGVETETQLQLLKNHGVTWFRVSIFHVHCPQKSLNRSSWDRKYEYNFRKNGFWKEWKHGVIL